jgi:hypothetical protein
MTRMTRAVVPGLPHHIISLSPDRPADDDSDRASAYHRATAWGSRNGSRCSSVGSATPLHPANPAQSRERTEKPKQEPEE